MAGDGRMVNVFFYRWSLRAHPAQAGPSGQRASSSRVWPGLALERNQGVSVHAGQMLVATTKCFTRIKVPFV